MIFEKYEVADVSTGYREESDLPLLLQIHCPTRIAETDGGFGTFHRVSDDDQLFEEDLQHNQLRSQRTFRIHHAPYAGCEDPVRPL